jgi:hypothetical protein
MVNRAVIIEQRFLSKSPDNSAADEQSAQAVLDIIYLSYNYFSQIYPLF